MPTFLKQFTVNITKQCLFLSTIQLHLYKKGHT